MKKPFAHAHLAQVFITLALAVFFFVLFTFLSSFARGETTICPGSASAANVYLCVLRDGANPETVIPLLAEEIKNANISLAHLGTNLEEIVGLVARYYDTKSAELSREGLAARKRGIEGPERFYERLGEISLKKYAVISRTKYLFGLGSSPAPVPQETQK